jgi:hypothetical protein
MRLSLLASLAPTLAAAVLLGSCNSTPDAPPAPPRVVYTETGMHAYAGNDGVWQLASTNFIDGPKVIPAGSRVELAHQRGNDYTLTDAEGTRYALEYVERHNMMPAAQWLERQFSDAPIVLPADLSEQERSCIAEGRAEVGISRRALFLAIGYPPASIAPDLEARELNYQVNRWIKRRFEFDDGDRLIAIHR